MLSMFMQVLLDRSFTDYAKLIGIKSEQLASELGISCSVFYTGYMDGLNNTVYSWFASSPADVIVIVISDFLSHCEHQLNIEALSQIAKKFIIVTEISNAQVDFPIYSNIFYVHMGPTLIANQDPWERVLPENFKNLTEGPHWISMCHNARPQRILLSAFAANYGLGFDPETSGLMKISIDSHGARLPIKNFQEWIDWFCMFYKHPADSIYGPVLNKLRRGYELLEQNEDLLKGDRNFFPGYPMSLDNSQNFDIGIRKWYKTSVLEIVNETIYFSKGVGISEKYLYTIMGFCFPIIISNPGTVSYLRNLGFDMFDDIINHHYDHQQDAVWRAMYAIENNLALLGNADYARKQWLNCYPRFQRNYEFVKKYFTNNCIDNFTKEFVSVLTQLKQQ